MDAYTDFAYIYDELMDNVPYEVWAERIEETLARFGRLRVPEGDEALKSEAGLMLDLCCGTGIITRMLRDKGHDCIGIDSSPFMLEIAAEAEAASVGRTPILYLNQDMRSFELYSTVGAIVCVCDSVNYLLNDEDVLRTFKLVNNYLYPEGLFIFDFNTTHYYRDELGGATIAENRENGSFIWENYYDPDTRINECDLTIYRRRDDRTDDYTRSEETHIQKGYDADEMRELILSAGMEIVKLTDSDTDGEVTDETLRVFAVAREHGKALNAL